MTSKERSSKELQLPASISVRKPADRRYSSSPTGRGSLASSSPRHSHFSPPSNIELHKGRALQPSLVAQAEKVKNKGHAEELCAKGSGSTKHKTKHRRHMKKGGTVQFDSKSGDEEDDKISRKGKRSATARRVFPTTSSMDAFYLESVLHECPLFRGCEPCALGEFAHRINQDTFEHGQEVAQKGRSAQSLLFLLSGSLDLFIDGVMVHSMNVDGSYIGETTLFGIENVWTMTIKAGSRSIVGSLTRSSLKEVVDKFPELLPWLKDIERLQIGHIMHVSVKTSCGVFEGMSEETINGLSRLPITRLYFPGQNLIEEEAEGDELYIVTRGRISVNIASRTVNTLSVDAGHKPVCFGELGLLGLQKTRNATICAQSLCLVRVLYRPIFLAEMRLQKESLRLQKVTEALQSRFSDLANFTERANRLTEIYMFKNAGCSNEFVDFLSHHLEGLIFLSDQLVVEENTDDKSMYFLTHGTVKVLKQGIEVARLKPGHIFGEMVMLGLVEKRTGTVLATETCYAERLHQSVVIRGLELFPEDRSKVFAAARMQIESAGLTAMSKEAFVNMFKHNSSTWQSLDDEFLEKLSSQSVDRIFLPGECITEEGAVGRSMFLLVTGVAGVYSKGEQWSSNVSSAPIYKKATLKAGSAFGELAMLGVITTRSATIKAETLCLLWELEQDRVQEVLASFPGARRVFVPLILKSLEPATPQRLLNLHIFRNFGQQFKLLLGLECERRVYFPQECIARGGHVGAGMYIINVGEAAVKTNNIVIMTLSPGNHFGSTIMLGVTKRCPCSLHAVTVCHILIVTYESFSSALLQYPAPSLAIQLAQAETAAYQEMKEAAELFQARANVVSHTLTHMGHDADMIVTELLEAAFIFWLHYTKEMREKRADVKRKSKRRWDEQCWAIKSQADRISRMEKERSVLATACLRSSAASSSTSMELSLPKVSSPKSSGSPPVKVRQQVSEQKSFTPRSPYKGHQQIWGDLYLPVAPPSPKTSRTMSKREELSIIRNLMYKQELFNMLEDQALAHRA